MKGACNESDHRSNVVVLVALVGVVGMMALYTHAAAALVAGAMAFAAGWQVQAWRWAAAAHRLGFAPTKKACVCCHGRLV